MINSIDISRSDLSGTFTTSAGMIKPAHWVFYALLNQIQLVVLGNKCPGFTKYANN